MINLKFKNDSTNPDPEYATAGSSGFDLRANITHDSNTIPFIEIEPNERAIIPTGLYFEIPENYEIQVRSRSGIAAKNGVMVLNSPGTIDQDFLGMVKIILINHSKETFIVNHGDRIAQAVLCPVYSKNLVSLNKIEDLTKTTERSSNGFGSTGLK